MDFNLSEYIKKIKLDKNDPDYVIEDYWYGFKQSMTNFYTYMEMYDERKSIIEKWSHTLNDYKSKKQYNLIEIHIKDYMCKYAIDIMKYDDFDNCIHSDILATNIKRWNKISGKFNLENNTKNKIIFDLYDAFNNIKCKCDETLYPILEVFSNFNDLFHDNIAHLTTLGVQYGQVKLLETIANIVGYNILYNNIVNVFPKLYTKFDKKTSCLKICKRFNNKYNNI